MGLAYEFRRILGDYAKIEDLVNLGAYERGNNKKTDHALEMIDDVNHFLRQDVETTSSMADGLKEMKNILNSKKPGSSQA